ncbi:purine-cytosine permease family protein [Rhodopila sp.]|uniref:purine-cytosine permease family protein n=1 Tax=Rhodopila sp. TaxID=2480087 RepID=UPI003D11ECA9
MTVSAPTDLDARLGEEFEHEAVPEANRKPVGSVAAIWFGFPMILTNALFGGIITYHLGFARGLLALLGGNFVLFLYVGALSYVAGRTGLNFAMQAKRTFGTRGYAMASAFLSSIVIGWYAFQTGLTGATLHDSFGWNTKLIICLAALLYTGVTFLGVRALTVIGMIAAPLYVILGVVALGFVSASHGLGGVTHYAGHAGGMSFTGAVTLVIATFADSGTMTADFTRWSRNGREAVLAAFTAFPVASLVAQLFGLVVVAAGAAAQPATDGGDFLALLTGHGALLSALAVAFVFVNLGSVCTHCLYNGAVGYSHLFGSQMRRLTLVLGAIGGALALAGVWSLFLGWLNVLGMLVPPIGAVMIVDQLLLGGLERPAADAAFRPPALIAWAAGAACALLVHLGLPGLGEAITGILVAGAAYALMRRRVGTRLAQPASR